MVKRRGKEQRFYKYECSLSGEEYKLTKKVDNVEDLTSISAYYQLHPDLDDRPAVIKKQLGITEEDTK